MQSLEDEAVTASIPSLSTSRTSPAAAATTAGVPATEDAGKPDAGHKAEPGMLSRTYCMQPASCLPKQILWPAACYVLLLCDVPEFEPGLPNSVCNIISFNVSALSVQHQVWVVCLLQIARECHFDRIRSNIPHLFACTSEAKLHSFGCLSNQALVQSQPCCQVCCDCVYSTQRNSLIILMRLLQS